ncbi:CKLF-like MARVEL transmembrane domain-containing protein 4 [Papilio machaon]|uniref:CKLF-like MARVEL transmembrane domain-containing protein 4 n=1 Tax=Papilio machaon TaxID=76193 RepID=A0A194RC69_PAPMA|nr:CKLF-like MARVEL transmembrane domain-containing protein 4 [Papilio machaon]
MLWVACRVIESEIRLRVVIWSATGSGMSVDGLGRLTKVSQAAGTCPLLQQRSRRSFRLSAAQAQATANRSLGNGIIGILCMALGSPWASAWFVFVAVTSFITTLMWSFVYLLSIREALKLPINWVLSELISTTLETFFYLIAFIVMFTTVTGHYANNVAAAVFGMFNTLAYAASSFFLFKEHKASVAAAS